MKRIAYVFVIVALLAGFANIRPAAAQGTWNTGIYIQNLTATAGTVTVYFYTSTGADAGNLSDAITAWGSLNFYLPSETVPAAGAAYSAVIQSDVQVAATVSLGNYTLGGADIYLGTDNPQTTLNFPLVYRNYTSGNWNSEITVQNATDTQQTNVVLKLYVHGSTTAAYTSAAQTIPAYASKTFNISDAAFAAFTEYGSAVVTGNGALAGTIKNVRNPGTGAVNVLAATYRAFGTTQKGPDIVLPLVYKNFNSWTTGINVANVGAAATVVTVTYTNANPAVSGGPWTDTLNLAAGAMGVFYTPSNAGLPNSFYGSAKLHSSAADIVAVVASQRYLASGAQGVNYEGSLPAEATACVSLPVVHNRTTWKTGINILNMSASSNTVTIHYYSSASGIPDATKSYTIAGNKPLTVYMPTDAATGVGFYGAADLKGTQPLLVNAAHSRADAGVASNFVGINYTCP